jgi:hypothetical protein
MIRKSEFARAVGVLGVLPACLLAVPTATAHADSQVLNGPQASATVVAGTVTCTVTQSLAQGTLSLNTNGDVDVIGTTSSTSNCNSTLLPYLYSSVTVENLNPIQYSSASNNATGSGFGPVTAQATDPVPVAFYGPSERFTFLTIGTTDLNQTVRICQQITTDQLLVATNSTLC